MDLAVGAAETGAGYPDLAGADEGAVPGADAGVQRGRRGDEFEHAARLVQVTDGLVAPLSLLRSLQGGAAFLPFQRVDLGADLLIHDEARLVGIVVRFGGHGQDRSGLHIHHDAHRAGGHLVLLHRGGEGALQIVLDVGVDGQRQGIARHSLHQCAVMGGHIIAPGVFGGQHPAVFSGQFLIVLQFQPPETLVIHVGEAQDTAHEISLRIDALCVLADLDALGAVFGAPGADCIGHRLVHAAAQQTVVGGAVAELFQRLRIVDLQDFRERPGRRFHQLIRQFPRGGADGPAGLAGGQQRAVGGIDLPPGRGQRGVPQLLIGRARGVILRVDELQVIQPGQQASEADSRQRPGQKAGAAAHMPVLLRCDVTVRHGGTSLPQPMRTPAALYRGMRKSCTNRLCSAHC